MKKFLEQMFSDSKGFASSKRGLGALCLVFSMIFGAICYFMTKDLTVNVLTFSLALITAGTALLGIGLLEKKP